MFVDAPGLTQMELSWGKPASCLLIFFVLSGKRVGSFLFREIRVSYMFLFTGFLWAFCCDSNVNCKDLPSCHLLNTVTCTKTLSALSSTFWRCSYEFISVLSNIFAFWLSSWVFLNAWSSCDNGFYSRSIQWTMVLYYSWTPHKWSRPQVIHSDSSNQSI